MQIVGYTQEINVIISSFLKAHFKILSLSIFKYIYTLYLIIQSVFSNDRRWSYRCFAPVLQFQRQLYRYNYLSGHIYPYASPICCTRVNGSIIILRHNYISRLTGRNERCKYIYSTNLSEVLKRVLYEKDVRENAIKRFVKTECKVVTRKDTYWMGSKEHQLMELRTARKF